MKPRTLVFGVLIGDLLWSVLAMGVAIVLRYGTQWSGADAASASGLLQFLEDTCVIWVLLSVSLPLDGFRGGWRLSAVISHLLLAVSGLMALLLSTGYLLRSYVSRLVLLQFGFLLFAGFVLLRVVIYLFLRSRSEHGLARRVVIVGDGRLVRELVTKIERHPEMLCRVVGFLAKDDGRPDFKNLGGRSSATNCGSALRMVDVLCDRRIDELIVASENGMPPDLVTMAKVCRDRGIQVTVVPQLYELYLSRSHLIDLEGLPLLRLTKPGLNDVALAGKRIFDVLLAALLSIVATPILLPFALVLHLRKGEAFRWERRCGFGGRPFAMLRLNMNRTATSASRIGQICRNLSLSELPQLWNVLRGDMSLVGPRPESPERVCRYSEWQQQRLTVKPGMTGLAQVQGLREQHSSEDKTRFDLQYLLSCSPWTDLSLLLQTIGTLAVRSASWPKLGAATPAHPVRLSTEEEVLEHAHRS